MMRAQIEVAAAAAQAARIVTDAANAAAKVVEAAATASQVTMDRRDNALDALVAKLDERSEATQRDIAEIKTALFSKFVTLEQFMPVRNIVYGIVSMVLVGVLSALLVLVVVRPAGAVPAPVPPPIATVIAR